LRVPGRRVGSGRSIGGSDRTTRVIDKNTFRARFTERGVPEHLNIQVSDDETAVGMRPGTGLVPITRIELQKELGDGAVPKLRDGRLLQGIKACLRVINLAQGTERQG